MTPVLHGRRTECDTLDRLLADVRAGRSRALVLRGEPGVGKTALLDYVVGRAAGCRIARAAGVESEHELAFAGLHQLCGGMFERLDGLPAPQGDALRTAFGLSRGEPPDRFLVGLAVLALLSELAEEDPLLCVVDDVQWLDRVSAETLAFVARRLLADRIGVVFAARSAGLAGLPELVIGGLGEADARALLASVIPGPVDARVLDRIVAETRGNPLALLELPQGLTPAELAGGFGSPDAMPVSGRIEEKFRSRLEALPDPTRRLVLVAAADPVGDVTLLWRAVELLGLGPESAVAAAEAGLLELEAWVRFRHPLVRSAVYRAASAQDRREAHRVLAEVTDPHVDPDRRAWHRAQAAAGPDEDVAAELERSAARAQARGGLAAAAAFLARAAALTPDPGRRAERELAAATAKHGAGALGAALGLLAAVEAGPADPRRAAHVEWLRGRIALDQRRGPEAARMLSSAARRLGPLDPPLARETHLEALGAAILAHGSEGQAGMREIATAALAAPAATEPPRALDAVLDACTVRLTQGYAAAAPDLVRALNAVLTPELGTEMDRRLWVTANRVCGIIALEVWDYESWHALAARQVAVTREAGALVQLQFAFNMLAHTTLRAGGLAEAAALLEQDRLIAEATRNPPVDSSSVVLAAMRGRVAEATGLIEAIEQEATARGWGLMLTIADHARALLDNGLGRHASALAAARRAFARGTVGYGSLVVSELAEAAWRTGEDALAASTLEWLSERTQVTRSDWLLGIDARVRALLGTGDDPDGLHRDSIEHLARTPLRPELARAHLLYGEWLGGRGRDADARAQLRTAHGMLSDMGLEGFAERAARALAAAGETARRRPIETGEALTTQEAQIARLAAEGLSNAEIGSRLFLSPRTVEWHLKKVFTKLSIESRRQLGEALADPGAPTRA